MGVSNSPSELAFKMAAAANAMGEANRRAVGEAALAYKERVLAEARRDLGGDLQFSRWGRRPGGLKIGAGYDVKGFDNAVAMLKARPQGPWKVLEYGAAPHEIRPRRRRRSRTGRRTAMRFPNGDFRNVVQHPGTPGKETWSRAIEQAQPGAMRTFKAVHIKALLGVFGGR